jgi:hypothetical protein
MSFLRKLALKDMMKELHGGLDEKISAPVRVLTVAARTD